MEKEIVLSLRKNVGVIPWWIRKFPGFTNISALAVRKKFYLNPVLYAELMSENPSDFAIGISLHELEHLKHSLKMGFVRYTILYCLNPKFRYQEELACHVPQFRYLKRKEFIFDLEKRAKILSGSQYVWCVSYKKAHKDLYDLWVNS